MAYASDKKPGELTALTTLATDDIFVVGDTSDASEVAKGITKANLITDLGTSFAAALGADDNYVTDAEKAALHTHANKATLDNITAAYTTAEATKLGHISITQAVDLDALETASHAAVTVADSAEIDFTLTGQDITASLKAGSIDETKLDTSVNASLDLADSALQPAAIGTTVQAYDADLTTWAGITPGTGVGTALAVNVGTAGAVVTNGGALGTPSSGTLTNCTGLPLSGVVDSTSEALGVGTLELGHASDTTISRDSAGVIAVEGVVIPSISSTNTLTNKRVTPRVSSETSSATPTINTDNVDAHSITALATAITSMTTNLSGTPTNFQKLIIRIKDNGTARAITWGASFEAKGVALPTTTVISKVLTVGFIYDTVTSKWGCVASVSEA